jgi:hypothetical protein
VVQNDSHTALTAKPKLGGWRETFPEIHRSVSFTPELMTGDKTKWDERSTHKQLLYITALLAYCRDAGLYMLCPAECRVSPNRMHAVVCVVVGASEVASQQFLSWYVTKSD